MTTTTLVNFAFMLLLMDYTVRGFPEGQFDSYLLTFPIILPTS